jgi:hypothetical protein
MMNKLFANFFMFLFVATAILMLVGITLPVFAQVGPGGGGNPCPGGEPCNPEVPITGIEWLLVIGGLFGFRKIYRRFRND